MRTAGLIVEDTDNPTARDRLFVRAETERGKVAAVILFPVGFYYKEVSRRNIVGSFYTPLVLLAEALEDKDTRKQDRE